MKSWISCASAAWCIPREVDAHFAHGKVKNWFGGSSNASTQLLDGMHYRGLLRIARREGGIRLYATRAADPLAAPGRGSRRDDGRAGGCHRQQVRAAAGVVAVAAGACMLKYAAPHWIGARKAALARAKARLPHATVDGHTWYWPEGENPRSRRHQRGRRSPAARALRPRRLGSPALRDVLGLGLSFRGLHARAETRARLLRAAAVVARRGHRLGKSLRGGRKARARVRLRPRPRAAGSPLFRRELDAELARMETFLGLDRAG